MMQMFVSLIVFGVAFIATRFATTWLFMQIAPPAVGAGRWEWWGTYVSILLAIVVAGAVMGMMERSMGRR